MSEDSCCFALKLNKGCLALGGFTIVCSILMISTSCTCIVLEDLQVKASSVPLLMGNGNVTNAMNHILDLNVNKSVIDLTLAIILVVGGLWLVASVVLVVGIRKNIASCVMFYFLVGITISIMFLLSGLLELLHKMWAVSILTFLFCAMYLYCLKFVYTAYELLWHKGALNDTEQLILDEDFDVEDVD